MIIEAIKEKIPKLINKVDEFESILRERSPEKRRALIEAVKKSPPLLDSNTENYLTSQEPSKNIASPSLELSDDRKNHSDANNQKRHAQPAFFQKSQNKRPQTEHKKQPEEINTKITFSQ